MSEPAPPEAAAAAAAAAEPPPFSGPATPSANSMLSSRISWGSVGSSSWAPRILKTVFSLISHKTLNKAGFILWQFKACFLACASSKLWSVMVIICCKMSPMSCFLPPSPSVPPAPSCKCWDRPGCPAIPTPAWECISLGCSSISKGNGSPRLFLFCSSARLLGSTKAFYPSSCLQILFRINREREKRRPKEKKIPLPL